MTIKKAVFLIIILLMIYKPGISWDDEVLFTSSGSYSVLKPNIMILLSNNRTMNSLIYHADFDPNKSYPDYVEGIVPERYHRIVEFKSGDYYNRQTGLVETFGKGYFLTYFVTDSSMTEAQLLKENTTHIIEVTPTAHDGVFLLDFSAIEPKANPIYLFGEPDGGNDVLIDGEFLNFMIYSATAEQRAVWNHFQLYGTWDTTNTDNIDGDYGMTFKTRMRVARKVMTETSNSIYAEYEADTNPDKAYPRVGLSEFDGSQGIHMTHPCDQKSSAVSMASMIKSILADADAPISEAFAEIWNYFRLGGTPDITKSEPFKAFPDCGPVSSSPITNWCQLNFIIVITDGMPTKDTQLRDLTSDTLFYVQPDGSVTWGDEDGDIDDDDTATTSEDGTYYLDDIAAYAYREDLYPDDNATIQADTDFEVKYKNKQFVYTYVIGYNADQPLLSKTAENGGGEYFTAENYESLTKAMSNVMASIDEKVRSYAAFAAPKYSLTYGDRRGYVATFVPKTNMPTWEGHLKCYKLTEDGFFPDLDNPGDMFLWDAGELLSQRVTERKILTEKNGSFVSFSTATATTDLPPSDFGFNSGDAAVDLDNRDKVIDFYHGNNSLGWRLGDIFHFGPMVVGAPLKWKAEFYPGYADFFDHFTEKKTETVDGVTKTIYISKREEVVYAGANDGMLHCFRVSDGEELWAFIPQSFLPKLQDSVEGVAATPIHQYFVDGKAIVTDIKVGNTNTWEDWKTVLIFGMGSGGSSYVALDVTDPNNPKFLWEFYDANWMGLTEAKPIVADIANDGGTPAKQVPAVFLSGGYDTTEATSAKSTVGKGFFILHAYYGYPIKKFYYGGTTSNPDVKVSTHWEHTNSDFIYSFVAPPTVLDYNYDGLADAVYMAESGEYTGTKGGGGRLWKVNLNTAPRDWRPTKIFQGDDGQTFYVSPTIGFDKSYNLWLFCGTGHRPDPNDANNLTGQFIAIVDNNTISTAYTTANLKNITGLFDGTSTDNDFSLDSTAADSAKGFYFNFVSGDREILFEPSPLFLNLDIYFNTYKPTSSSAKTANPCISQGNQSLYTFSLDGAGNNISIEGVSVTGGKIQGYGSLSGGKYNVYIGDEEAGSVGIKSQETVDVSNTFGILFWTEKKK